MQNSVEDNRLNEPDLRSTLKEIMVISAPMAARNLILALRFSCDREFLAAAGSEYLSIYGSFGALQGLLFSTIFTGQRIVSILASQNSGAEVGKILRHASLFSLIFSAVVVAPICLAAPLIFSATKQSEKVIAESRLYFIVLFFAFLFDSLFRMQARVLFGLKKTYPPLFAEIFQTVIDLSCMSVLIEGRLGFPKTGVHAPAFSYLISASFCLIANTIYLAYEPSLKEYDFFKWDRIELKKLKEIAIKALPTSGSAVLEMAAQTAVIFYIGLTDPEKTAGVEVAKSYSTAISYFLIGFAAAGSILMGKALQENKPHRYIASVNLFFTVPISAIIGSLIFLLSAPYTRLFLSESDPAFDSAVMMLRTQTVIELFNTARSILISALEAHRDVMTPLKINGGCIFMLNLLFSTLAKFGFDADASTIYMTQVAGAASASIAFLSCWQFKHFKQYQTKNTLQTQPAREEATSTNVIEMEITTKLDSV